MTSDCSTKRRSEVSKSVLVRSCQGTRDANFQKAEIKLLTFTHNVMLSSVLFWDVIYVSQIITAICIS